jgi:predicted ribosomally synthesized peptide with nif11-like leader
MSLEQLKAFLAKVKDDSNLREKLKAAKSPEDVVGIAKEHGHDFGTEHISLLSDEDLEGVAGGSISAQQTNCAYC